MPKKTYITFILDETGSMQPIKLDTIGGFNEYTKKLAESGEDILFTLLKFDSNHQTVVHASIPIKDVAPLTVESYNPGAATPLVDACVKAIYATADKVKDLDGETAVSIVIQTDGHENASTEYESSDLHALIKEKTDKGWLFTFLGAGIDAFETAREMGISTDTTMSYGRTQSATAFAGAARSSLSYAHTHNPGAATFTTAEREAAADTDSGGGERTLNNPELPTSEDSTKPKPKPKPAPVVGKLKF